MWGVIDLSRIMRLDTVNFSLSSYRSVLSPRILNHLVRNAIYLDLFLKPAESVPSTLLIVWFSICYDALDKTELTTTNN